MEKKLTKSVSDKKIMGVCGGLTVITGGSLAIAYLIAGFMLPEGE